jgi:hypothetical protein
LNQVEALTLKALGTSTAADVASGLILQMQFQIKRNTATRDVHFKWTAPTRARMGGAITTNREATILSMTACAQADSTKYSLIDFLQGLACNPKQWPDGEDYLQHLLALARVLAIGVASSGLQSTTANSTALKDAFVLSVFAADSPIVDLVSNALCNAVDLQLWQPFIAQLINALQHLPQVDDFVQHWERTDLESEIYAPGSVICWTGFLCAVASSDTLTHFGASELTNDDQHRSSSSTCLRSGVLFRIRSRTAKSLSAFCIAGTRYDVIFEPRTKFKVVKYTPQEEGFAAVIDLIEVVS